MNRTPDLLITNELLYQLSYSGEGAIIASGSWAKSYQFASARLTTSRTSLLRSALAATRAMASRAAPR